MTERPTGAIPAALMRALVAAVFAVDPVGLGGVLVRSAAGTARDQWLQRLRDALPDGTPWRRIPLAIHEDRLLGGLDLSATLHAGRPVPLRGVLAEADGGIVLLAMAERTGAATAAHLGAVLDWHEVALERHGLGVRSPARIGVVALDEGGDDDDAVPGALTERLALRIDLNGVRALDEPQDLGEWGAPQIEQARRRYAGVRVPDEVVHGLCATAAALGVDSARAWIMACRVARAAAALDGRDEVHAGDAEVAAALVLAPRATQLPDVATDEPVRDESPPAAEAPPTDLDAPARPAESSPDPDDADSASPPPGGALDDVVLAAALASVPAGLLAALVHGAVRRSRVPPGAGAGARRQAPQRGRPVGARPGEPRGGSRLHLMETLRAAAPWQRLRQRTASPPGATPASASGPRIHVRREDFHVWRFQQRAQTTTIFVVDASGSSALNRLAEAKGAVELLLADCYVRRDSVAVIAFRGTQAQLLLPPTRSLVRAKRSLAGLPGGGGTPLAAGLEAASDLAAAVMRRGATPVIVVLTDGRANVSRDGRPGRAQAGADALAAAGRMRAQAHASLLLDTSPQPQDSARVLAEAMGARYLALPHAGAAAMSQVVRAASPAPSR